MGERVNVVLVIFPIPVGVKGRNGLVNLRIAKSIVLVDVVRP